MGHLHRSDGEAGTGPLTHPVIRPAEAADAGAIARLLGVLGYPDVADAVALRLATVAAAGGVTVVALDAPGDLVGVASVARCVWLHRARPVALLTTLVVQPASRGHGVGRALVAHVEELARAWGCEAIELTSNDMRVDAHRFYERLGFASRSRKFAKRLAS